MFFLFVTEVHANRVVPPKIRTSARSLVAGEPWVLVGAGLRAHQAFVEEVAVVFVPASDRAIEVSADLFVHDADPYLLVTVDVWLCQARSLG